ncbi:hypothetical protein ABZ502_17275 [Streptomyces abikoensis]|uniref:hypothetical protein n=1 Tax=Streptomyces abikoensis TaxID=97398 RepID=UPI0033DE7E76
MEQPTDSGLIASGGRVAYRVSNPQDRDVHGVLWGACGLKPGAGLPQWARVHPQRQRRAMGGQRCQVCAEAADVNNDGVLWLLDGTLPSEGTITTHPPVCRRCPRKAVRACPPLRNKGHTLVRVKAPVLEGVYGRLYLPSRTHRSGLKPGEHAYVPYADASRTRWVVAEQLYATLHGCTPVNLDDLAADGSETEPILCLATD